MVALFYAGLWGGLIRLGLTSLPSAVTSAPLIVARAADGASGSWAR